MHIKESKKSGFTFSIKLKTKFAWSHGLNIAQVISLENAGQARSREDFKGYFPAKILLWALGQHCSSNFLVQCCLRCT